MRRVVASLLVVGGVGFGAGPALAATSSSQPRKDLVILSGDAVVPKGQGAGDVQRMTDRIMAGIETCLPRAASLTSGPR